MKGRYSTPWWKALTKDERRVLVGLMTARAGILGGSLPDDCSECGNCGAPMLGSGLCDHCFSLWNSLHAKADAAYAQRAAPANERA